MRYALSPVIPHSAQEEDVRQLVFMIIYFIIGVKSDFERIFVFIIFITYSAVLPLDSLLQGVTGKCQSFLQNASKPQGECAWMRIQVSRGTDAA